MSWEDKKWYNIMKDSLQKKYKPIIMEKCNNECVYCGARDNLDLHHLTPVLEFVENGKQKENKKKLKGKILYKYMEMAYKENNLVITCRECHSAYHNGRYNNFWE